MTRAELIARRDALGKFYHQCYLGKGVFTRPWTRETLGQWYNGERGERKMSRFIEPVLDTIVPIKGATILEVGCNAGINGIWALKRGASFYCGIEADRRYWEQSLLVRHCYEQRWRRNLPMDLLLGDALEVLQRNPHARKYDVSWAFAFIYHIPPEKRVPLLKALGEVSEYVVLQGNGIEDAGNGRGSWSMGNLVLNAGLRIVRWRNEEHVRGAVIVARRNG